MCEFSWLAFKMGRLPAWGKWFVVGYPHGHINHHGVNNVFLTASHAGADFGKGSQGSKLYAL
jgi:hypothetical protein